MGQISVKDMPPPERPLPRIASKCARKGCGVELEENGSSSTHRTIGPFHVCRNCYQATWELSKSRNITLVEAFRSIKPKGWKPEPPLPVICPLPWCGEKILPKKSLSVGSGLYTCGRCRSYLHVIQKRANHQTKSLENLVSEAVQGMIPAPNTPELCAMRWCSRYEIVNNRGPNGEPLCNSDGAYLRLNKRRKGISLAQAFKAAPPPRLVHTRK